MVPAAAMAVGGGISTLGGILGYLLSMGDREQAMRLMQQSMDESGQIDVPTLERLVAETMGPSEAGNVTADPRLGAKQDQSLAALQGVVDAGGMTAADDAVLNKNLNQVARRSASANENILSSMRSRNAGGAGAEFALRQANAASAADRSQQAGLDVAGTAQQRALDAMIAGGNMAGQMRGQQFDEKFRAAQARDHINQYNASARERAARYNAGLAGDRFGMQIQRQNARNGARGDYANALQNRASSTAAMFGGAGQGAGQVAYGAMYDPDEYLKNGGKR